MKTEQIVITVDAEAAQAYNSATDQEKRKLDLLLSLRLLEVTQTNVSLADVMSEISSKAKQRGLTPELLQELLDAQ